MGTEKQPAQDSEDFMRCVAFPNTYTENTTEEKHLLFIANSFQRQFSLLYPDRKPLLLCPVNECGVKKFVSTTLRPTMPGLVDLVTWQQCASFVSNYLTLQLLDKPTELPTTLRSPQTVLQSQHGSTLEYASLLCSLLLGLNYNAYCVSGYASKHLCELDRSQDQPENEPGSGPDPDPLWGLRVHFWVLVLAGSRSVEQDFFIEPLTGNCFPTDHRDFLGVESMWNELNLYVNMQDCTKGCQDLVLDPEDQTHWEPLVYGTPSKKQLQAAVLQRQDMTKNGIQQDEDEEKDPPYTYFMPQSWCNMIDITDRDLEMCWPGGCKEPTMTPWWRIAPEVCPDGVITRLIQGWPSSSGGPMQHRPRGGPTIHNP